MGTCACGVTEPSVERLRVMLPLVTATLFGPVVRRVLEPGVALAAVSVGVVVSVVATPSVLGTAGVDATCAASFRPSVFDDTRLGRTGIDVQALVMLAASNPMPATIAHFVGLLFFRDNTTASPFAPSQTDFAAGATTILWRSR
jgi:hypothetical protein